MAVCKGDGIPSEGKSMHKGRGGGQISNFEGWDERVPADIWGLENTGKRWERESIPHHESVIWGSSVMQFSSKSDPGGILGCDELSGS